MNQKTENITEKIEKIGKELRDLQNVDLISFFNDDSIPVQERFRVWFDMPSQFGITSNWVESWTTSNGTEVNWYEDYHIERKELVSFSYLMYYCDDSKYPLTELVEEKNGELYLKDSKHAKKFFDKFIRKNITGFRYDW